MVSEDGPVTLLYDPANLLLTVLSLGLLALKIWALVDCATRPAPMFEAHNKLTKQHWLLILAVVLVLGLLFSGVLNLFSLVGAVAAIVYLVDVRPAVSGSANPWN
ncbi:MAG: hypothetical protein JWM02_1048 [Frankiales bacterium]|nr:hypothetical protein [Frankiales bacterium]